MPEGESIFFIFVALKGISGANREEQCTPAGQKKGRPERAAIGCMGGGGQFCLRQRVA